MIALLQRLHAASHPLDDTRTLVAEKRGERERDHLVLGADIGVADAGRDNPNDDLVVARIFDDEISQFGRSAP